MTNLRVNPWGAHIQELRDKEATTRLLNKIANPKNVKNVNQKILAHKDVPMAEKIRIITESVTKILSNYRPLVELITTKERLHEYIDHALITGSISVDTETYGTNGKKDGALDPLTCKLAGPCLYTKGEKAVYIPVNHLDYRTGERLPNQLTEQDIADEFARLKGCELIMHNGPFDYSVIKCTCNIDLVYTWDTQAVACIIDENEEHGLKDQYVLHIDKNDKDYSFGSLFGKVPAAYIPPEVFVLYAAIDSYKTDRLKDWQVEYLNRPENQELLPLIQKVDLPVSKVAADMELRGVCLDKEYAKILSIKYHKKLDKATIAVNKELALLKPKIDKWKLSDDALRKPVIYMPAYDESQDSPASYEKQLKSYPLVDADGKHYKYGKSKLESLEDPINIDSPAQVAILVYDIIGLKPPNPKKPRAVGKDELEALGEECTLCKLLLERRGILKLTKDFIEALPTELSSVDGKIHTSFNALGTVTGRFSCSKP